MNTHRDLIRELKTLRKGRGVYAGRIEERVGPTLRATCGIADDDGPVTIRRKLEARLSELAEQLPEDLCLATRAAFALGPEVRLPLYRDRVLWAAIRIDRDPRTVRRRVDDAIVQLAELATTTPPVRTGTWHTAELRIAVALDRWQPAVLEQHRVVADRDDLRELTFVSPFQVALRDLDVLYGGTLLDRDDTLTLVLPRPLARGETHDFAVWFRLPNPHAVRSHLVHVPDHLCELFDLRVRFGQDRKPSHVWSLHGAHQNLGSDPVRHSREHPVDQAGEVHLTFRQLVPGLAYGAQWELGDEAPEEDAAPSHTCGGLTDPRLCLLQLAAER